MAAKRKALIFDPNKSDSNDSDFDDDAVEARPQKRSKKSQKTSPRKRDKPRRQRYGNSSDDIEDDDSIANSEEEASFTDSEHDRPIERNPRTGRGVRSATKKVVKYEENSEDEDEIAATDSDHDPAPSTSARSKQARRALLTKPTLIVRLKVPPYSMENERVTRTRTGSRASRRAPTPTLHTQGSAGGRRSSRLSHDDANDLVALTDSGRHHLVTRAGSGTPQPSAARRATRGGKGLASKKPPSAIFEVSHEGSIADPRQTTEGQQFFSQLEQAAHVEGQETERIMSHVFPTDTVKDEDIRMELVNDEDDEEEEQVVQESQTSQPEPELGLEPEDNDDDEGPITKGRTLRARRKASTPPPSQPETNNRRSLRNRKSGAEQSSDFEPDADGEIDADQEVSDSEDDLLKPGRGGNSSNDGSSQGRRSGRITRKSASQRSRSRRQPSADEELDVEEIADEAAELDEDRRRNRRSRGRRERAAQQENEINFEPTLRSRGNRPDYRIIRPELLLPIEEDDAPAIPAATPRGNRRGGGGHTYRSLFSTYGPFGGGGGPPPILGGPEGIGAAGGVDSDSSDDEIGPKAGQTGSGAVGMTPTSAFPKPFSVSAAPQALNNDPLTGAGGGPPGLGKVKDKKALADADPLGVDTNVTFDGVGGLDNHINQLKEMVALPLLYPEVFQRFHVTPPRGVLFHGPPGTGKTLLARALASSVSSHGQKVTFYMRKGADALSKWVGEAEKQLRLLFEEARKNQPSIIFFDEIDGLAPVRSSKQEQIHASIVATLLALMDGMDGRGQVIVIGATNRPDSVDPALRRPGRFDREFYFPLPDVTGRRKIIDIHTKGWDPPLKPEFRDQLAEVTRGYGGADLRALCTEAALNAVQGTYPQIYSSDRKLIIDPSTIKVLAKDFMISVNKIVPSSERSAATGAAQLKKDIEPLLRAPLREISDRLEEIVPRKRKATALEEAMYDDRNDEFGFQKEVLQQEFESSRVFRPRLLIKGRPGMGQQYLGAALLSKFEGLHVQSFDLATLMKDSTRSSEAAVVQMFEEVKRHKPSVIYIPNVGVWWDTVGDAVKRTFVGLLRSLPPTDPILLLGILEYDTRDEKPDQQMLRDLFGFSRKDQYELTQPHEDARYEYWNSVLDFIRRAPDQLPDPDQRKKRKLAVLPEAPVAAAITTIEPTKAELKAQRRKDHQTLNVLKLHIQQVMDQIKLRYKKFRNPPIEDSQIMYLFDDSNPKVLTTDLTEEQRQQQSLFRPFEVTKDHKGVPGLREISTNKFYYNMEIVTIEKRLSNGYYKRPKDFLADIKRLSKDAKNLGEPDRLLKANEMLANVEVDMATLETQQAALCAECEGVYEREQVRERTRLAKLKEAQRRGEVPSLGVPAIPDVNVSKTSTEESGGIVLGQQIPERHPFAMPSRVPGVNVDFDPFADMNGEHDSHQQNGSHVEPQAHEDIEMLDSNLAGKDDHQDLPLSQQSLLGSQPPNLTPVQSRPEHTAVIESQQQHSNSTTISGTKSSDHSSGPFSQYSNGPIRPGDHPDFGIFGPASSSGSQNLPDTQPPSNESQQGPSQHVQVEPFGSQGSAGSQQNLDAPAPRPHNRISSVSALLNDEDSEDAPRMRPQVIMSEEGFQSALKRMVDSSSGLSLEQMEQCKARTMDMIWKLRGNWNRDQVLAVCANVFNATVEDIEACQDVLDPSQRLKNFV
ncbi:Putative ATPase family AAA domain-containing protein ATAD2 [Septoria linicola]|uniref:ATPase family AAA domain-containing protein ATAD2 n=1 Tax=Septoria linicola TaxID=215465 RepID=A0A9Q9AHU0_9PEZI|nr:putative ATPase family AAA domain-containing protein ATAD2 [Septoria linicola]USW47168.1 Putative ATPase family AAA domain-containing protein ATAD2 [Septoria linicola]